MVYLGTYRNGVVVLDEKAELTDGARVGVDLATVSNGEAGGDTEQNGNSEDVNAPTVWQELATLAGSMNSGRHDASVNHDHYLYGTPKRKNSE